MGWRQSLILLSLVAVVSAIYAPISYATIALIATLALALKLSLRDQRIAHESLEQVATAQLRERDSIEPVFSGAVSTLQALEALRYRVHELEWQIDRLASSTTETVPDFIPAEIKQRAAQGKISLESVFESALTQARANFRADSLAIIYTIKGSTELMQSIEVVSVGAAGAKPREDFIRFASPYLLDNDHTILGVHAIERSAPRLSVDFSYYGYTEIVAQSFDTERERGIVLLGYRGYQSPTEIEKKLLRVLARQFETELPSLRVVSELSTRAIEAETSSQEKSTFLAQMSHDIRGPLTNIKVCLNYVIQELGDSSVTGTLQNAITNCDAMNDLLTTILDFSRHKAGKLSARPEAFDLLQETKSVVERFSVVARERAIALNIASNATDGLVVYADRKQTSRIIANLVSNAIKFTTTGAVTITVNRTKNVTLEVADTGVGMTAQQVSKLFEPFTRHHTDREGIGLGLALTKVLCELNGGKITGASEYGKGSTFRVELPTANSRAQSAEITAVRPKAALDGKKQQRVKHPTVLVIDDDQEMLQSLTKTLERNEFFVNSASSEKEAIGIINFAPPDVIICDLTMPGGGARRVLLFLTERNLAIPVIVLTGNDEPEITDQLLALGARHVEQKPVDFGRLVELLLGAEQEKAAQMA